MHLSEAERTDTPGVEREELITWYLEQRESELESVEEFEQERELIGKALNKLVKVHPPFLPSPFLSRFPLPIRKASESIR
jgi:hypothetical protein